MMPQASFLRCISINVYFLKILNTPMCISLTYSYTSTGNWLKIRKLTLTKYYYLVVDLIQILPIKKMFLLAIEISITLHSVAMSLFISLSDDQLHSLCVSWYWHLRLLCSYFVKCPSALVCLLFPYDYIQIEESMVTHSSILAWRIPMDRGAW